jgi:hypothetical protein
MGTRLTGSALPRARHCAWPYRLDVVYPERPSGQAAEDGVETHTMLEHWLEGEPVPAMGPRPQTIFEQVKAYFGEPGRRRAEVAFAIDLETGAARVIGYRLGRQYGALKDSELALTVDWAGEGEVGDLKTGFAGHVAHPRENLQLQAAAYALAKTQGLTAVIAKVLIAREDETVPLFAKIDDFDAILAELREIHFRTQLPSPAVAGEHCQFCPALGACPQTTHLAVLEGGSAVKWTTECLSTENDAAMVMHLPMLEKAVDAIKEALKQRGPIQLPNGKIWKETFRKIVTADKKKLEQLPGYAACLSEKEVSNGFRQVKP